MFMTVVRYCREKQKKYTQKSGFAVMFFTAVLLCACQNTVETAGRVTKNISSAEQPLQLMQSMDGVQDIRWELNKIQGEKAQYFHSQPYLLFNPQLKQLQGSTGCNALSGHYEMNVAAHTLSMQARAGYDSCDSALAQEAMLMDVLGQTAAFQIEGRHLTLRSRSGQVLLQATKK
jgi:heat shock protein HslJ